MQLKDDNGKPLPKKVQKEVNDFIDGLKNVTWFKPSPNLKEEDVDKQVKLVMECFGVDAEIEYRALTEDNDSEVALDTDWIDAWCAASDAACGLDSINVWIDAWEADSDAAKCAAELLVKDKKDFKEKYPNGAFIQFFKLWEMGLCPAGVLKENKKFVVYVPPCKQEFPFNF